MNIQPATRTGALYALYRLFNPIPFGFFIAALLFDQFYMTTAEVLWAKAASWLITFGLLFAIVPRLINLFYVWFRPVIHSKRSDILGFWLYGFAILIAILNAFIHGRDAYAIVPTNVILSGLTVCLISISYVFQSFTLYQQTGGDL